MPPVASQDADDMSATASFCVMYGQYGDIIPDDNDVVAPPSPHKKMDRRRSVDFVEQPNVVEIDMTDDEESKHIWYSKDEYDIIKARNSLIVKMMKKGNFTESEEESFRGLEHKLRENSKERVENKYSGLNAVLECQDRQYARGVKNEEVIKKSYEKAVEKAKNKALIMGMKDHEESLAYAPVIVTPDIDDDISVISDLDDTTQCSEDTSAKKTRLKNIFGGISERKKNRNQRRASM